MLALLIPLIAFVLTVTLLVGRGILFSWSARDIDQMIPYVTSIDESIGEFKELLSTDFGQGGCKRSWREKRAAIAETLQRILEFLGKFDDNSRLFGERCVNHI